MKVFPRHYPLFNTVEKERNVAALLTYFFGAFGFSATALRTSSLLSVASLVSNSTGVFELADLCLQMHTHLVGETRVASILPLAKALCGSISYLLLTY